ncbi:hypothetical protein F5148DRAFT_1204509, partial [Russula earlei]
RCSAFFSRKQQPAAKVSNLPSDAIPVDSEPQQLRTPSPSEWCPQLPKLYTRSSPPLASFFATLTPPPLLHCVRCHADYTEVENDDRSCHVPHDDESADVARVGRGGGRFDSEYETYYGCCGKLVEGGGDLGPPDGWCYEGKHTTDIKRARFRADATNIDDKLDSCFQLNCHNIRARLPKASSSGNGRAKPPPAPPSGGDIGDDEGASDGTEDTGIAKISHGVGAASPKGKARARAKAKTRTNPKEAVEESAAVATPTRTPARARARVRVQVPRESESDGGNGKTGNVGAPAPATPATGQRPRKRRHSDAKPRSAASSAGKATSPPTSSPAQRGRKPPSVVKMDSVEVVVRSRRSTHSRMRGDGAETGDEKTMTDEEGKVRKRRKVAAA